MLTRTQLNGNLILALAARWLGWLVAGALVLSPLVGPGGIDKSAKYLLLLPLTFIQSAALTAYLVYLEPTKRASLGKREGNGLDTYFVVGLIDLMFALGVVALTIDYTRISPFYLFGLSALLVPATQLSLRAVVVLAAVFVGGYAVEAVFVNGPHAPIAAMKKAVLLHLSWCRFWSPCWRKCCRRRHGACERRRSTRGNSRPNARSWRPKRSDRASHGRYMTGWLSRPTCCN